ncbi:flagellar hook-associated protein FliD [Alkalihalophilus pseudofirmus OF4]|uniref:Flagellar hook-associated protein 2 n=1 Tax=Alkalihalophilus pseudofirmus (strain ATCC BAA-2126 / JCM 17055 / OF4) TaxID=398511 RepID=D3FYF8_ALKPO|nr:flagellar hook-associated protein 2 [Alkalihalophilus pseudofirmus]ADC49181.1 flagellar hook-associated protein FliD [Alkalihalophilus pseudofirmus OF4]
MRMGGLASGMDTEQIMRDLMRAERMPVDNMVKQRQVVEWQMDAYREVNRKFNEFRNKMVDQFILTSANLSAKRVTSSNSSLVSATASASSGNVSLRISQVNELARAESNFSAGRISGEEKVDTSKALKDQKFDQAIEWKDGAVKTETIRTSSATTSVSFAQGNVNNLKENAEADTVVKVNGKEYEVVQGTPNENQVAVDYKTGTLTFANSIASGAQVSVTFIEESETEKYTTSSITTFDRDGKEVKDTFVIKDSETLSQVFQKVNRSNVGVSIFYDEHNDGVSATRKETGINNKNSGNEMVFGDGFFNEVLKLKENYQVVNEEGDPETRSNVQEAKNAVFTINGMETQRQTNTFTIDGVTITLRGETVGNEEVSLNVSTDTDKVFDTIKGFVDQYNELLDFVNGKLTEERYRDYKPLTDEERDAISEKEAERWDERAQSGMLRNDRMIQSVMDRMRTDIYGMVSNNLGSDYNQLSAIGITTSRDYNDRGKLEINEDRLRQAIERDPAGVAAIFNSDGPTSGEKGIIRRMRETLTSGIDSISSRAGGMGGKVANHQFTLGREIESINTRITNFERRLQQVEDRYWRQFTAMEKAMQQANAQAESLFAQLYGNQ